MLQEVRLILLFDLVLSYCSMAKTNKKNKTNNKKKSSEYLYENNKNTTDKPVL